MKPKQCNFAESKLSCRRSGKISVFFSLFSLYYSLNRDESWLKKCLKVKKVGVLMLDWVIAQQRLKIIQIKGQRWKFPLPANQSWENDDSSREERRRRGMGCWFVCEPTILESGGPIIRLSLWQTTSAACCLFVAGRLEGVTGCNVWKIQEAPSSVTQRSDAACLSWEKLMLQQLIQTLHTHIHTHTQYRREGGVS